MGALGNNIAAAIAFNRFGLGGRPDDIIPASPSAWLLDQLIGPDPYTGTGMPSTAQGLAMFVALQQEVADGGVIGQLGTPLINLLGSEVSALMTNALTTRAPFRERLVWFWFNHFALMAQFTPTSSCAGAFVREAIRPHVTGTFQDMLLAVMQHPAMIMNLNNTFSAGPDSVASQRCVATGCTTVGINENLARECLELHTLGVNGGYAQADVDALAMLITGWSVNTNNAPYGFMFSPRMHEPVAQTLMKQNYPPTQAGGIAALIWLATQPATYQHLATKLVTHFVSDAPSPSDIATIAGVLASSGGNLGAASAALVHLPSAWRPYVKIRTPMDYVVAVLRGVGATRFTPMSVNDPGYVVGSLGSPVWKPDFPNGYSDLAADWAGAAQMLLRADWINALCSQLPGVDPGTVASNALGPLLRPSTAAAMNAATSTHDQLSLLFLAPEFQRR